MPFQMSIRGGRNFSKSSEIQKVLNYPRGVGGASLIGSFSKIFPFFFSDASPKANKYEIEITKTRPLTYKKLADYNRVPLS